MLIAFLGIFLLGIGITFFFLQPKINQTPAFSPLINSPTHSYTLSNSTSTIAQNGDFVVEHHSHPTKMSLQGRVTDANGNLVDDGNLTTIVSDQNSCVSGVFYQITDTNAIQDGFFNILLGDTNVLSLNYNQDYYLCLKVNGELLSGPAKFVGGQGQIGSEDVASSFSFTDLNTTGKLIVKGDLNAADGNFIAPIQDSAPKWGNKPGMIFYNNTDQEIYYRDTNEQLWLGMSKLTFNCGWNGSTLTETWCNSSGFTQSSGATGKGWLMAWPGIIKQMCVDATAAITGRNYKIYADSTVIADANAPTGSEWCTDVGGRFASGQRLSISVDNAQTGETIWIEVRRAST